MEVSVQDGQGGRDVEDPHDLVAVVIDDLDHDLPPGSWTGKGTAPRGRQGCPHVFVDVRAKGPLELLIGLVSAAKVCVPDEETGRAIARVDEPTCDVVGRVRSDLPQ